MQLTLKAWRVNTGLTMNEVAQKLNKTERTLQNWENGTTIPDRANLEILANLYGTTIDHIFLADNLALSERYDKFKNAT